MPDRIPGDPGQEPAQLRLGEAVAATARRLAGAGVESAATDARWLIAHALGLSRAGLLAAARRPLTPREQELIRRIVARRLDREPVDRIIGEREFYGRRFMLTRNVLSPRPETELLVETVLGIARTSARDLAGAPRVLDVGTGSGAILLTLLAELPDATGAGSDVSAAALEVARANAGRLGVLPRTEFRLARSLQAVGGPYDIVVANPPYIPTADLDRLDPEVRLHDPLLALDGGTDGLDVYREIAAALRGVAPGGHIVMEVGAGQAGAVCRLLGDAGVSGLRTLADLAGHTRCVAGRIH